jgi:hypothetical protein
MSQKVLQISAEDAKYIDPNQIASLTLTDGTQIIVKDNCEAQEFVEEANQNEEQYTTEQTEQKQQPLRGLGTNIALGVAAAGAAALGAAALGSAMRPRPMMGPVIGGPMMRPPMMGPPMVGPHMMGPHMMGPGMRGPGMRGPMGRRF